MLRNRIAFSARPDGIDHIYTMAANGTDVKQLTSGPYSDAYPSWHPSGEQLAFWRQSDGVGIYVVNVDGSGLKRLSPSPGFDVQPWWSPDGKRIVFVRFLSFPMPGQIPPTQLMTMAADGSDVRVLLRPDGAFNAVPRWSPDGSRIAIMRTMIGVGQHIYTLSALDGLGLTQLTTQGLNGDPAWSPDSRQISFGSNQGGGNLNLFVMDADGSNVRQLTHFSSPVEAGDSCWSPDGKYITFELDWPASGQSDPNTSAEVWVVRADGSNAHSTNQSCSAVGCAPRWSPVRA